MQTPTNKGMEKSELLILYSAPSQDESENVMGSNMAQEPSSNIFQEDGMKIISL